MNDPPPEISFDDQFAFRPTGSATAALINLISIITNLLRSGKTVVLISLDFSKAFDRVKHQTLFEKYGKMDIPDVVYNWLTSYFDGREHCTKFMNNVSSMKQINSSVVQGSVIGPSSYSIAESDLRSKNINFWMDKFADDVDLITTLDNYDKIQDEIEHVDQWAKNNNLILNKDKSREIIFRGNKSVQGIPPPLDGITRVNSIKNWVSFYKIN